MELKACLCVYARLKAYICPLPHLFLSLCSTKAHADSSKYKQPDFGYNQERSDPLQTFFYPCIMGQDAFG